MMLIAGSLLASPYVLFQVWRFIAPGLHAREKRLAVVFQLPTIVLFLARLRLVTARQLWRHFKHAILIIFIAAALLTPTPDPWSQIVMAAPMLVMYLLSMGIAWLAAPRTPRATATPHLRLIVAAAVLDQARRRA